MKRWTAEEIERWTEENRDVWPYRGSPLAQKYERRKQLWDRVFRYAWWFIAWAGTVVMGAQTAIHYARLYCER